MSPIQRSLKLLRDEGYEAEKVEQWIPMANVRKDLFDVIDIVAVGDGKILGVQVTTQACRSGHIRKIQESEKAAKWKANGGVLVLHTWEKIPLGKTFRWRADVEEL